jgi:predicted ATPase/DNA-binding winged helix-turn-helix (wHTH) protein/class 3 adenylate cyclase
MRFLFGECTLDTERYELHRAGQIVPLEPKAFRVLVYLVQHHDRAVAKQDLLQAFWPGTSDAHYKEYSLRNCLHKIRQAVGEAGTQRVLIETLRGHGYRLAVAVTILPADPGVSATAPLGPEGDSRPPASGALPLPPGWRQVTVLRCELAENASLARLDHEDFRTIVQVFYTACEHVIQHFGGYIAQYDSHGLLAYFGYPLAYEDAAQRAVRAGLGLVEADQPFVLSGERGTRTRLAVCVSIHTGQIVVEEQAHPASRVLSMAGRTVIIARRAQERALPDTVVLTAGTYALVQGYFICQALDESLVFGDDQRLALYRVLGESGRHTPLEVAATRGLTPFVGREAEMALLLQCWEQARDGVGHVVVLSGEPGIGKSRLVQVLRDQLPSGSYTYLECRSSPYYQNTALYPMIGLLERVALRFDREESPAQKLHKLERFLVQYGLPLAEAVPLLATLLSLPLPPDYAPLRLSLEQQRQKTLHILLTLLLRMAAQQPLLFVMEDLHWVDPSTLELLTLLVDQGPTARILALFTLRTDFSPPWTGRAYLTQLTLTRLSPRQAAEMIRQVVHGKALPTEVLEQVLAQTDGVPLFVEELTKMVLESGLLQEHGERYALMAPLPPLAIPATLHDSLMARLDRLAAVKGLAQLAATLGREFSYELLQALSSWDEDTLQRGLQQLVASEFLYQRGLPPQATYLFKHALIQEAAYQSLLKSTRQQYHQRIAQVVEARFPKVVETQPELLAHHYTEAGLLAQAIPYRQRAGQQALQRSANLEAVRHLTLALELLTMLPETPARAQQELDAQIALGPALMATRGYGAPEVEQTYARARELCRQVGETPQLFPTLRGLCWFYRARGVLPTARELGEQFVRVAERAADPMHRLEAHEALGSALFYLGDYTAARMEFEQGIALIDPAAQQALAHRQGDASGPRCLSLAALVLWCLGYPTQAVWRCQEALALAQDLAHPYSLASAQHWAAYLYYYCRVPQTVQAQADALLPLATAQGFPVQVGFGTCWRGWALVMQGASEAGLAQLRQGLAAIVATGQTLGRVISLVLLAEAAEHAGQIEEGLGLLAEARTVLEAKGYGELRAETYRLQGTLLLRQAIPDAVQAEACFQEALTVARRQQVKSWELRAAMSLSRLWQQQGKRAEAYDLLAPIYGWFTEGFDTADLQEARMLLEELS